MSQGAWGIQPHSGCLGDLIWGRGRGFVLASVKLNKSQEPVEHGAASNWEKEGLIVGRRWKVLEGGRF